MNGDSYRAIRSEAPNRIAKVVSSSLGGGYDLEYTGGIAARNVSDTSGQRWAAGDWVTVERVGDTWCIVGASASATE